MNRILKAMTILFVMLCLNNIASAAADIPPVLASGTRQMWAVFGFGPALEIKDSNNQFKMIQQFGYHLNPGAVGPAIGFDLQESFSEDITTIELGPKFSWDIQLVEGLGLYLSPSAMIGFAHISASGAYMSSPWGGIRTIEVSANGLTIQLGIEGKLFLADRGVVFFRPLTIDIMPLHVSDNIDITEDEWNTGIRWDLLIGGGIAF